MSSMLIRVSCFVAIGALAAWSWNALQTPLFPPASQSVSSAAPTSQIALARAEDQRAEDAARRARSLALERSLYSELIPYVMGEVGSVSRDDIVRLERIGATASDAESAARALACCDVWLLQHADTACRRLDRERFFGEIAGIRGGVSPEWRFAVASTVLSSAIAQEMECRPLSVEQRVVRDAQREIIRTTVLGFPQALALRISRPESVAQLGAMGSDFIAAIDLTYEDPKSCVGVVPISSERFDRLLRGLEGAQEHELDRACDVLRGTDFASEQVLEASLSPWAGFLGHAMSAFGRAAFADGFAGRGVPLRVDGFGGSIMRTVRALRVRPSAQLD